MSTHVAKSKGIKRNLTDAERNAVYQSLLLRSENGKIPYGTFSLLAKKFKTSRRTITRIWKRGRETSRNEFVPGNVNSRKKGNSGPRKKDYSNLLRTVESVPLNDRSTTRSLASKSGIARSTLHRAKQRGVIVRHTNAVHPSLTPSNRISRLEHAIKHVSYNTRREQYYFHNMHNYVHLDEKRFNIYEEKRAYYMTPREEQPYRHAKSKRYIGKVMFLCAVARPRYDFRKRRLFDGKNGVWPFVEQVQAQRSSKNRPAGTFETKPINVDRDVYRHYLIHKVLPAIKDKFPFKRHVPVLIQQDNARPHISENDPEFAQATSNMSSKIEVVCQPPNSPDFNVLDLGFFRSLDSMQSGSSLTYRGIDGLINAVKEVYNNYLTEKLSDIFITHQTVLESSMEDLGNNSFKIKHTKKSRMSHSQKLTHNHACDPQTYMDALNYTNSS